jgi:NTP pyrophosphatase (non-canonical NTP hydrolase)
LNQQIIDELGDVLWYVSEIATTLNFNLSAVARRNLDKLADRQARDAIGGSGDNR